MFSKYGMNYVKEQEKIELSEETQIELRAEEILKNVYAEYNTRYVVGAALHCTALHCMYRTISQPGRIE